MLQPYLKISDSEEEGTGDKDFGLIVNGKCDEGKKRFYSVDLQEKNKTKMFIPTSG
jgi:hypothetical protein